MANPHVQEPWSARFDWGPAGAETLAGASDLVAVVDVLSFTTALTVAVDAGIEVFPFRWRDRRAARFAQERDAVLAVGRSEARPGQISLSASTIRTADRVTRLVLPSPNGSTIAHDVAADGTPLIGVSLRNATAAADWTLRRLASAPGASVAVIAAGERRPDGSLRPAVEDLWGAGAYLTALEARGFGPFSPEAFTAAAAYRAVAGELSARLRASASGRELIEGRFGDDVEIAAEVDLSTAVPVLRGESFTAA
ncbi:MULTISPECIES: 2-phosphosulfolactate phosphatase [unclassified Saccharopolyspora]|uniref:2-phosphosulfolactate phosphatase n=1 Tax=unclassified Saccharopolyspora TaxID=2646250 RepID=UPI001CD34EF4|nr:MULTISPECIES: 2-phosphosulfolactate phosphatase [unclassified Saccharopolyspora]MCA1189832.1 2-phosphosulfolactate phosphatase [Saccharopolyspora sp. 6T]MCA1194996.1 2-phosphosulfolactate phosphatase [Saccharopolyspora sp. 6V]MCA1283186.1 2-phosphosulfolactate phosphatase [Saccharopolyspora sp. 7B]